MLESTANIEESHRKLADYGRPGRAATALILPSAGGAARERAMLEVTGGGRAGGVVR